MLDDPERLLSEALIGKADVLDNERAGQLRDPIPVVRHDRR